jgi:hypothetical protein
VLLPDCRALASLVDVVKQLRVYRLGTLRTHDHVEEPHQQPAHAVTMHNHMVILLDRCAR